MGTDGFAMAVVGLMLAIFGIVLGFGIGSRLAEDVTDRKTYWKYNAVAYAAGILVSALVWATGWSVLAFGTVGCLGGVIAGLKMGYGEAVGPWVTHDRFLGLNTRKGRYPRPKRTASTGTGWARRRPDGEGESDEPELMSVSDPEKRR